MNEDWFGQPDAVVEMMQPTPMTDGRVKLAEHAEVIRTLGKRVVGDITEIC
jgi:hypothetical protein